MRTSVLTLSVLCAVLTTADVSAAGTGGVIHRVQETGETYADLAEHYYGRRYLERHLRLLNRRREPLPKRTSIIIPTYRTVAIGRGQTLASFAATYLNDSGKAEYLALLHRLPAREESTGAAWCGSHGPE